MSSLSQEESRSISENTTWGQRRRFAAGNASVAYKQFLGYDDRYRRKVWRCNQKYKEHGHAGNRCSTPTVTEEEIKAAFIKAMNSYLDTKDEIIRNIENARKMLCSIADLEKEKDRQAEEMNVVSELMHRALEENATVAQDQEEYEKKYAQLEARYNVAEEDFHEAEDKIEKQRARNRLLCQMTRQLKDLDGPLVEFDAGLWGVFVEQVTVLADRSMVVRFKDGTEIPMQPDKPGGNAS